MLSTIQNIYQIAMIGFGIAGVIFFIAALFVNSMNPDKKTVWSMVSDLLTGFSSEMIAAIFTALFIGIVIGNFQDNASQSQTRDEYVLEMGSPNNDFAIEGTRKLRSRDWLIDGSINGSYLVEASLQGTDLSNANLQDVNLTSANLDGADLSNANLQGANLQDASLRDTILTGSDLTGANLQGVVFTPSTFNGANLTNANLSGRNLRNIQMDDVIICNTNFIGATLTGTGLNETELQQAVLDESTRLPSGDFWTEDIFVLVPCGN